MGTRGYFVTINAYNRMKYFTHKKIIESLIGYLQETSKVSFFDIVVYCFMPDHLHLVVEGKKEESNLLSFIHSFKQKSGFAFKKVHKQKLWATSFHDRTLRKSEDIRGVGRYTLANPVKANLVKHALEYPYSGSFVYDLKELVQSDIPAYYAQV
ncbi:MAG: hypothetical protein UV82_C0013G0067 [Candidatus Magasanikbacteria bacterium GW2011_GWD2_43_18]|uniref:Transposase IS200-like domain-containing protein n=1 Tax=Candidatus Magasanikbacteria bacterium GW2011_GWE2_42_7 TaxID=1619052 RepID=A0A0G1DQD1_9BACT|nr:MAG: hypothetical protein UV18_C0002G0081 [Candidatus Magasanikbacteria bacterium GW2011_GWC2_42_27]KKS73031.1 MAG: hypothetical protein UV42_C0002G0011 [Candidatus Magasanikbacteria bacterium GW2011_GWE2_42_7]KKT03983.1 MAG: hypothetical protein UV82_C0013G0067 [Candidatus Magasanikbacteria bacterium GW2011_GWD2_43_18]